MISADSLPFGRALKIAETISWGPYNTIYNGIDWKEPLCTRLGWWHFLSIRTSQMVAIATVDL